MLIIKCIIVFLYKLLQSMILNKNFPGDILQIDTILINFKQWVFDVHN
jgi:hypothetical protein